eukprot:3940437-Rhodomonas_salina.2
MCTCSMCDRERSDQDARSSNSLSVFKIPPPFQTFPHPPQQKSVSGFQPPPEIGLGVSASPPRNRSRGLSVLGQAGDANEVNAVPVPAPVTAAQGESGLTRSERAQI